MGQDTTHKLKKKRQKRYLKRRKQRIQDEIQKASGRKKSD